MSKATKLDLVRRDKLIQELMGRGLDKITIIRTVCEQENIAESTARRSYDLIVNEMQKLVKDNRHELRANLMARQEEIFKRAIEANNLKTALDATNAQAKLGGLYDVEIETAKRPDAILFKERDFSTTLEIVKDKAANDE